MLAFQPFGVPEVYRVRPLFEAMLVLRDLHRDVKIGIHALVCAPECVIAVTNMEHDPFFSFQICA